MSRRIIEVYVAAICFTATVSILLSAPQFFRARHATRESQVDVQVALAGYKAAGLDSAREILDKELSTYKKNELDYDAQRESLLLTGAVMAGHVALLFVAEVIFWKRSRRPKSQLAPNNFQTETLPLTSETTTSEHRGNRFGCIAARTSGAASKPFAMD